MHKFTEHPRSPPHLIIPRYDTIQGIQVSRVAMEHVYIAVTLPLEYLKGIARASGAEDSTKAPPSIILRC